MLRAGLGFITLIGLNVSRIRSRHYIVNQQGAETWQIILKET